MKIQYLLRKSQILKTEAQAFLVNYKIEELLKRYFNVYYTGSFSYDLMCWRDIDIVLEFKNKDYDIKKAFNYIFSELIKKDGIIDIHYIDGLNFKVRKGLPKGHYLGFDMFDYAINDKWKVDIWLLDPKFFKDKKRFDDQMKAKLSLNSIEQIIELKFKYMGDLGRVPSLISYYIYQAVLFEDLETEEEITRIY
jgi:hypothetical protein